MTNVTPIRARRPPQYPALYAALRVLVEQEQGGEIPPLTPPDFERIGRQHGVDDLRAVEATLRHIAEDCAAEAAELRVYANRREAEGRA